MENFSTIIITATAVVFAIIGIATKRSKFISTFLITFMLLLCIGCKNAYDLLNLEWAYTYVPEHFMELAMGFNWLSSLFIALHLDFTVFKAVIAIFSLAVIYSAIKKHSYYHTLVLSIFLIYPFISMITQIRNGMSAAIVIYALLEYIYDPKHNKVKYTIGILLACLFHYGSIAYLLFLFVDKKIGIKKTLFLTIFGLLLLYISMSSNWIYIVLLKIIHNVRFVSWFDFNRILNEKTVETHSWKSTFVLTFSHIAGFIVYEVIIRRYIKQINWYSKNGKSLNTEIDESKYITEEKLLFIEKLQILSLIWLPLYSMSGSFFRLYYNMMIILYVILADCLVFVRRVNIADIYVKLIYITTILYAIILLILMHYKQTYYTDLLNSFSLFGF